MRKFCKDCNHEPVCGSPHTEHTLGCDYWQKETVDAVEVVRCEECKHYNIFRLMCYHDNFNGYINYDGFCSYGERRDSE